MLEAVSIPAAVPAGESSSRGDAPAPASELLVIEDDPFSRQALTRLLQQDGYAVTAFATAREARDWLSSPEGRERRIDGGVIDVHLPDGDGIELTRQLRRMLGSGPRIVIVSGDTTMPTLNRLRDAGADGFIGKPLRFPVLLEELLPKEKPGARS